MLWILLLAMLFSYLGVSGFLFWKRFRRAVDKIKTFRKYERKIPNSKEQILILGDSAAFGVGADNPENSVAGRLANDYPDASILNYGVSGYRVENLLQVTINEWFKTIFVVIGANDIVRFSNLKKVESDLRQALIKIQEHTGLVVLLHGGNVGAAWIWPRPLRWIYSWRTKKYREICLRIAKQLGVVYVDMHTPMKDFPHLVSGKSTYAPDAFHPSDVGYGLWHERILKALEIVDKK